MNTQYAKIWPNFTVKGTPPADRDDFERETGKFDKYFDPAPGRGELAFASRASRARFVRR